MARMRETSGIFLYTSDDRIKLHAKIKKTIDIGRNIADFIPSLCSPHGNWLKIGIKGGRLL